MKYFRFIKYTFITVVILAVAAMFLLLSCNTYVSESWQEYKNYITSDKKYSIVIYSKQKLGEFNSGKLKVICQNNDTEEKVILFEGKCSFDEDCAWTEFCDTSPEGVKLKINDYHNPIELNIVWSDYF